MTRSHLVLLAVFFAAAAVSASSTRGYDETQKKARTQLREVDAGLFSRSLAPPKKAKSKKDVCKVRRILYADWCDADCNCCLKDCGCNTL